MTLSLYSVAMTLFCSLEIHNTAFHFTVYLVTPSAAHINMQGRIFGHLMNENLERMWKEIFDNILILTARSKQNRVKTKYVAIDDTQTTYELGSSCKGSDITVAQRNFLCQKAN